MEKLPEPPALIETYQQSSEVLPVKPAVAVANGPDCAQEDALAYLRCSSILIFHKGDLIYGPEQESSTLYLVIDGKVKVSRVAPNGQEVVIDLYLPDEFFGESAFVQQRRAEKVTAVENTQLMTWTAAEIEATIDRKPRLGLALAQIVVKRSLDFQHRLESLSADNVAQRLARALIRFSERLGKRAEDGSILMQPFTHALLAQYVGTSREIVTVFMMQFRRDGYLRYSRKGIVLHREALKSWLLPKQVAAP